MFNIDNHEIVLGCPNCRQPIKVTLKQVADQKTVACTVCSNTVNLIDKSGSASKVIKDINKALSDLRKGLSRLGKK